MQFFTSQKTINGVLRQAYTGSKSAYVTLAGSPTCYLRPLDEEQSAANGLQYGLGFSMIIETDVDVQEADKVQISGITYTVAGVATHDRGGVTAYTRAILVKPKL